VNPELAIVENPRWLKATYELTYFDADMNPWPGAKPIWPYRFETPVDLSGWKSGYPPGAIPPFLVTNPDGRKEEGWFPYAAAPHPS